MGLSVCDSTSSRGYNRFGVAHGHVSRAMPRVMLGFNEDNLPFVVTRRRQFAVAPSFAMTVYKVKGQTLERVSIFSPRSIFSHGRIYAAVSRATSPDHFHIIIVVGGTTRLPDGTATTCATNNID